MANIKISEVLKLELERAKEEGKFKSLDGVIRYYLDSFLEVKGGIFLGTPEGLDTKSFIEARNIRKKQITHNFTDTHISPPQIIILYKCLKCNTLYKEPTLRCICGEPITKITINLEKTIKWDGIIL